MRDWWWPIQVIYFAAQPGVLALALLASGGLWMLRRRWRVGAAAIVSGVILAGWWATVSFRWQCTASDKPVLRAVVWNIARGLGGYEAIERFLGETDADIIAVVEPGPDCPLAAERLDWPDKPAYIAADSGATFRLFVRGPVSTVKLYKLTRGSDYAHFRVELGGRELHVILVDIASEPWIPRERGLRELARVLDEGVGDAPVIVLGDFNTPPDSVHLDAVRSRLTNAFEAAGCGYQPTWPMPLPVVTLDQVWLGGGLSPKSCRALWSIRSDHRPVMVEFR